MLLRVLDGRRLARTQLAIDLQQGFFAVFGGILQQGRLNALVLAEELDDLRIRAETQRTCKHGNGDLTVLIDANVEHVGGIGLILQPRAAVGDDGGAEQLLAEGVVHHIEVHTGGTHELGDDNTLRAVDDEGAALGHNGEIAHKDLGLLDLTRLLVEQTNTHV